MFGLYPPKGFILFLKFGATGGASETFIFFLNGEIILAAALLAKAAPAASASPFDDEEEAPVATAPVAKPAATGQNAQDILAMIRARQKS